MAILLLWEFIKWVAQTVIPPSVVHFFEKKRVALTAILWRRVEYQSIVKEVIHRNLERNIEAQLELYKRLYDLHFRSLYLAGELTKKKAGKSAVKESFNQILDELTAVRSDIFKNMIFAPAYFTILLHAQIGLEDETRYRFHRYTNPSLKQDDYKSYDHSDKLDEAARWLMDNMRIDIDLRKIESLRNEDGSLFSAPEKKRESAGIAPDE